MMQASDLEKVSSKLVGELNQMQIVDRSQSLFYFVPQEKNFTVKLARLFWDCNDDDHGDHDVDDLTGGSRSAL